MVQFITVFFPAVFLTLGKPPLRKWLKGLLISFIDHKILSSSQCDSVVVELIIFMTMTLNIRFRSDFEDFSEVTDSLDNFWFEKAKISHFKTLTFVVKLVLTLFHGQALGSSA